MFYCDFPFHYPLKLAKKLHAGVQLSGNVQKMFTSNEFYSLRRNRQNLRNKDFGDCVISF